MDPRSRRTALSWARVTRRRDWQEPLANSCAIQFRFLCNTTVHESRLQANSTLMINVGSNAEVSYENKMSASSHTADLTSASGIAVAANDFKAGRARSISEPILTSALGRSNRCDPSQDAGCCGRPDGREEPRPTTCCTQREWLLSIIDRCDDLICR